MIVINQFISEYGTTILMTVLTAIAGWLGKQIKFLYEKYINDKTKKNVVETCVKAVEQLYRDKKGAEKLNKAKDNIIAMLTEKGLVVTELELDMLIESVVSEFNINFKDNKS